MTTLIIKSKKDLQTILDFANKNGIPVQTEKPKTDQNEKEKAFYKKFSKAVKEANAISKSKTKGKSLKALLDEKKSPKRKSIAQLSKETNQAVAKKLLELHNISYDSYNR